MERASQTVVPTTFTHQHVRWTDITTDRHACAPASAKSQREAALAAGSPVTEWCHPLERFINRVISKAAPLVLRPREQLRPCLFTMHSDGDEWHGR